MTYDIIKEEVIMMLIEYKDNTRAFYGPLLNCIRDVFLRKDGKSLKIMYGANGDLYLDIYGERVINEDGMATASFEIEESDECYSIFLKLVSDIRNAQVFEADGVELELCSTEDERNELIEKNKNNNVILMGSSFYQKLVNGDQIIWYSDSIYDESANCLKIKVEDNKIFLQFIDNPSDPAFGFAIRVSNHGSKYDPFNLCFMRLYNSFQELSRGKKLIREEGK